MEWVLIFALGAWTFVQGRGLKAIRRRLDVLERRDPVLATDDEPFLWKTGLGPITATRSEPELETQIGSEPGPWADRQPEPEPLAAARIAEPAPAPRPRLNLAAWISEHGLAWLGGGALVLGGLFLVTYAAQRGVFTPALRIAAAIASGLVMIGASEWVRRLDRSLGGQTPAALLAGAGAATLYGAVWASDRLYGFIGLQYSAPLLALISAGLLGLALRHGAPLALAALAGAYLAPVVTNGPDWGDGPLTAYLILILVTGYGVAALRRWDEAAWIAAAGAAAWSIANLGDAQDIPAALLLFLSPALALAAGLWRRRSGPATAEPLKGRALAWWWTPAAVLGLSSLLSLGLWRPPGGMLHENQAALLSAGLVILGALAAVARLGPPMGQVAPYVAAPLALALDAGGPDFGRSGVALQGLGVVFALILSAFLSAFAAARAGRDRADGWSAGTGAICAALAVTTLRLGHDQFALAWIAPAVATALMALAAAWLGRRSDAPEKDLSLAFWIWPAAFLAAEALERSLLDAALPAALAGLALVAAVLHARLRWRGFGSAALVATLAMLAALIGNVAIPALQGRETVWTVVASVTVSVGLVWASGRLVRRNVRDRMLADALGTGALIGGLMGGFLLLRFWGSGQATLVGGLDRLTELAFGTILLLAAGLVSSRGGESLIGRYRGPGFLALGLVYGLIAQGVVYNPLWPSFQSTIKGPPILDAMLLAYLAPAMMLAAAVRLRVSPQRAMVGLYAAAAVVFALLWGVLELRRLFQGPTLHMGLDSIGRAEGAAYALLGLIVVRLLIWLSNRTGRDQSSLSSIAGEMRPVTDAFAWSAAILATVVFGYAASPWWGPITRPFASHPAVLLLLALYGAGGVAWLFLARLQRLGSFARPAAVLQLFVLLTLVVRYGFRGLDMATADAEARLETWAFSAIWALYGLGALVLGAQLRDLAVRWTGLAILLFTTAKVFIFDMARLDGMVRAASFLALGALLITAALAARRFGGLGLRGRDATAEQTVG